MVHKQTEITLASGKRVSVDAGIASLIRAMNVEGLKTTNSCQGGDIKNSYVQFSGKLAKQFIQAFVDEMFTGKRKTLQGVRFHRAPNPTWPDSYSMGWQPYDSRKVIRWAKIAAKKLAGRTTWLR